MTHTGALSSMIGWKYDLYPLPGFVMSAFLWLHCIDHLEQSDPFFVSHTIMDFITSMRGMTNYQIELDHFTHTHPLQIPLQMIKSWHVLVDLGFPFLRHFPDVMWDVLPKAIGPCTHSADEVNLGTWPLPKLCRLTCVGIVACGLDHKVLPVCLVFVVVFRLHLFDALLFTCGSWLLHLDLFSAMLALWFVSLLWGRLQAEGERWMSWCSPQVVIYHSIHFSFSLPHLVFLNLGDLPLWIWIVYMKWLASPEEESCRKGWPPGSCE